MRCKKRRKHARGQVRRHQRRSAAAKMELCIGRISADYGRPLGRWESASFIASRGLTGVSDRRGIVSAADWGVRPGRSPADFNDRQKVVCARVEMSPCVGVKILQRHGVGGVVTRVGVRQRDDPGPSTYPITTQLFEAEAVRSHDYEFVESTCDQHANARQVRSVVAAELSPRRAGSKRRPSRL